MKTPFIIINSIQCTEYTSFYAPKKRDIKIRIMPILIAWRKHSEYLMLAATCG